MTGAVHACYPIPGTSLTRDLYPFRAADLYALSKLLQEKLCRNFYELNGLSIAMIRPWAIIDTERMMTTDGSPVTKLYWVSINLRDVASLLVRLFVQPDNIDLEELVFMAAQIRAASKMTENSCVSVP